MHRCSAISTPESAASQRFPMTMLGGRRHRGGDREPSRGPPARYRADRAARTAPRLRRRLDLRLRLDRAVGRARRPPSSRCRPPRGCTGFRGDPAGPPISIGGDLGEYMGGRVGRARCAGPAAARPHRRCRRAPRHVDARSDHADAERRVAALAAAAGCRPVRRSVEVPSIEPAKDGYVGISMVTGQQWLDFAAMVDCPEFTEIAELQFQIGPLGLPRLDPRAHRPVDARTHRRRDRRAGATVPAADGPAGQRRDDPGDGPSPRARLSMSTIRRDSASRGPRG